MGEVYASGAIQEDLDRYKYQTKHMSDVNSTYTQETFYRRC